MFPKVVVGVSVVLDGAKRTGQELRGLQPNNGLKLPVLPVTPRACARVAPVRPAGYAQR